MAIVFRLQDFYLKFPGGIFRREMKLLASWPDTQERDTFIFPLEINQIKKQEGYHFNTLPFKRIKENMNVSIKLYGNHTCNIMNFLVIGS